MQVHSRVGAKSIRVQEIDTYCLKRSQVDVESAIAERTVAKKRRREEEDNV
jgi:hypothetical protein